MLYTGAADIEKIMQQVCSSSLRVTTAARKLRQLSTFRCYSIGSFVVCNATTHRCVRNHPEYSPYQKRLASNATSTTVASSTATPDAASSSTDFASSLQEKWAADAATLLDEGVADLAGETLTDVGLGGYSPVGLMESLLDGIHSFTGLPWWMTIVLTAIGLRTAMIPLTVYGRKKARKLREINPEVEEAKDMKRLYKRAKSRARVQMEVQKLSTIYKKAGVKPISALLPYLGQLGLVFVGFRAIKNLAHAPILSMFTEGTLIFPDLTAPSIPLTLINCAAMVAAFRVSVFVCCWMSGALVFFITGKICVRHILSTHLPI